MKKRDRTELNLHEVSFIYWISKHIKNRICKSTSIKFGNGRMQVCYLIYLSIVYLNYIFICYFIYYIFISNWAVCLNSNYLCMFSEGARMRIWFIAVRANISLLRCMDTYVLLFITAVCKTPFAGLKRASERFFTCNKKRILNPITSCNIHKKKQQQQQLKCYLYVSFHEFSGFPPVQMLFHIRTSTERAFLPCALLGDWSVCTWPWMDSFDEDSLPTNKRNWIVLTD